ncbi:MAG: response regulator [Candidatus Aenigmarchaeota archaeon]|nr:response regulator [Candidatus Aenigmarchaeota archaeon]
MANQYATGDRDILIVDDDPNIRQFYRRVLERRYTTEEASDGKAAFRFTNNNRYGLVITDIGMPDWSGLDFIDAASLVNPNQSILVIDKLTPELIEELENLSGVVGRLNKPITEEEWVLFGERLLEEVGKYVEPSLHG